MISSWSENSKVLYLKQKLTLSKTTEWLSMSSIVYQEEGFCLFHLFGVVSDIFQPLLACYGFLWFHFLQATISQNVLTCKFTMSQFHVDFITKDCKCHY